MAIKNRWSQIIFFSMAIMLSGKIMANILVPDKVYLHDPDFLSSFSLDMPNTADEFYDLIKLADNGNSDANWMVATIYDQSNNGLEAEKYYQRSIDRKDNYLGQSAVNLGYIYDKANNIEKAMTLFQFAGDAGYSNGYKALATEYFLGHSIPLDFAKAKVFYKKAADLGCIECQDYIKNWDDTVKLRLKDLE
ncbi:sel1 repeat family protein [Proteus vulgaris]|uniref:tetratricopeptide repeat protein n=1 Tax=Proteus TaxID=583 RepID=UPI000D6977EB|nr:MULTISPECIES: sel1 repeat family protein [Proteus]MBQ0214890.1 sel1 repeat family protein [Proteus vulgaris]MDS0790357.1 sel1 repeat family protein [Proteus vulgaris]NBM54399.1 sel1 repeat family protein [Proteus sp. G2669]UDN36511.1 sel1 repeat family protein [Proteus sp. NMG38-2]UPK81562.1 sel1 repeat family protein [Proteus vulgaris]